MSKELSVQLAVTSRDRRYSDDVLETVIDAIDYANDRGLSVSLAKATDAYNVATCRNRMVASFLKSRHTHLMFVDDDVLLPKAAVVELAKMTTAPNRDIVAGCYPTIRATGLVPMVPYLTIQLLGEDGHKQGWVAGWFDGEPEIAGAGTGCMLITRHVFNIGHPWFRWVEHYDEKTSMLSISSDDMDFCDRARIAGFRIWANGAVRCGHRKTIDVAALIGMANDDSTLFKTSWVGPDKRG